ncbi:rhodanese-like domain-containing protein [Ectothiorhodospiraceae bacterium BW-2]|nr:rhodanese-like domain-containing protein [Ectothiorhodospiraceae bacterium BW-2]
MKHFNDLIAECLTEVDELFPWDLEERLSLDNAPFLLDVREPEEYRQLHIPGSINAPRGILETCCEWDYEETIPELVEARDREVVVICRSGNRSVLAAHTLQRMGYKKVISLKTGIRGWNDYEQPLVDQTEQPVAIEQADEILRSRIRPEQRRPPL